MSDKPTEPFALHFGAMVEPIGSQIQDMGYSINGKNCPLWQKHADAITHLSLHGLLPPRQVEAARRRLVTRIHREMLKND